MAQLRKTAAPDLQVILDIARSQVLGCWRHRWLALGLAWVLCCLGWLAVWLMPNVYGAYARVYVDTQSVLRPLLEGLAVGSDVLSEVALMERAVMSHPNLEKLVRDTGLGMVTGDRREVELAIVQLQKSLKLRRDGDNTVTVSYENIDREKSLHVVTTLLNQLIEGAMDENQADRSTAEKFLVEKLKEYELRLNESEAALADFKRKNIGLIPGDSNIDYYGRLQTELAQLGVIEGRLRAARNRRSELQRQIEGEEPVLGLLAEDETPAVMTSPQDRQILELEQRLADLRLRYTETHPQVVAARETLEQLRERKEAAFRAGGPQVRAYSSLNLNPVYQQMKIQLSQVEVELAQLQAEYSDQAGVVADLRRKVNIIPEVEAELKRLVRDDDVNRSQYDDMLRRVEAARVTEEAGSSKGKAFRVIDPPKVLADPVGPNRPLLFTAVLVLALGAGAGMAIALNLLRPVFFTGKDLERRFGLAVIGTVRQGLSATETMAQRQTVMAFAGGVGLLLVSYGLLLFLTRFAGTASLAAGGLGA